MIVDKFFYVVITTWVTPTFDKEPEEKQEVRMRILLLLVPLTGVEPVCLSARDFKSLVSANSTTATSSEQSLTANDYSF